MIARNNTVVAVYKSPTDAGTAVKELQQSGFDMKKLSLIGPDYHTDEAVLDCHNTGGQMKSSGKAGTSCDAAWELLFGSTFILIPGVGPLFVAGPLVAWVVGGLEGVVVAGGLRALAAELYSLGFPKGSLQTAFKFGKFVVIAHGDKKEATRARGIIIGLANREASEKHRSSHASRESSLAGAVILGIGGLNTVGTGLHGIGIPKNNLLQYETALKSGKFVVIAHGNEEEATCARQTINLTHPEMLQEHQPRASRPHNF